MKINRSVSFLAVAATLVFAGLGMTGVARAGDVYWSVGVSSPGVQLGVSSGLPVMVQPMYRPVYRAPRPVVYVQAAPAFMASPRYIQADWRYPGHGRGWQHGQGRHENERFEPGRFGGEHSGRDHQDHRRD